MGYGRSRGVCTVRIRDEGDPKRLERARAVAERLDGVVSSEANYLLRFLTIEYDPDRTTLERIRGVVKAI